jgi:hypothetical protein
MRSKIAGLGLFLIGLAFLLNAFERYAQSGHNLIIPRVFFEGFLSGVCWVLAVVVFRFTRTKT